MTKLLGIDVGSTTVKVVAIGVSGKILYKSYVRHFSKVKETVLTELHNVQSLYPGEYSACNTGSAG